MGRKAYALTSKMIYNKLTFTTMIIKKSYFKVLKSFFEGKSYFFEVFWDFSGEIVYFFRKFLIGHLVYTLTSKMIYNKLIFVARMI